MNIGPSTSFTSLINDFHSVVDGTVFYTNAVSEDPPPPTGPVWFGYDGPTPVDPDNTIFFSINGKELVNPVSQGFITVFCTATGQGGDYNTVLLTKSSGYSGNAVTTSDDLDVEDFPLLLSESYYLRFQSDANVPLRMYLGSSGFPILLTQAVLPIGLFVILAAGTYSKLTFVCNGFSLGDPTLSIEGLLPSDSLEFSIGEEISSYSRLQGTFVVYVNHDPTIMRSFQKIALGRSI